MRLTDRGWVVVWIATILALGAFVWAVDAWVMDLTPTQQEMESLR